ncbi:MAG: U32 family peptidase, partial [Burkholderiales bacterium]|nr:U32 family peptidase [Burkholderiales bacterium]
LSARCFTARHEGLSKDRCEFRCLAHPDGIPLSTQEGQPFLNLNGIQVLSARCQNLLPHVGALRGLGVDVLRLSPQHRYSAEVARAFAEAIAGRPARILDEWSPEGNCDGYWNGEAGIASLASTA